MKYIVEKRHLDKIMTTHETDLLHALLGSLVAHFEPRRDNWQTRFQRRDKFCGRYDWQNPGMIPWSNPGDDGAQKKAAVRAMTRLAEQGLARHSGKEAGLTPEGIQAAYSSFSAWTLDDVLPGLDFIMTLYETDHEWIDKGWQGIITRGYFSGCSIAGMDHPMPPAKVGECRLTPSTYWIWDALPILAMHGLIDHKYRAGFELPLYYLTPKGRTLAEQRRATGKAEPKAWLTLSKRKPFPEFPDVMNDSYWRTMRELEHAKPLQENRIDHGLASCMWPDACLPDEDKTFKKPKQRKRK
jgi:hypothetical protein